MADLIDFARYRRLAEPVGLPELEFENPLFVDWLTVRQVHDGGGLPVVTDGYLTSTDADGLIEFQTAKREELEGSFDSRMWVRCDGNTVEFHGNISRWHRPDNVFGFSWVETVKRVNQLIVDRGLPPFSAGTRERYADAKVIWTGARVSRIDITMNYTAGSEADGSRLLLALGQHHIGRQRGTVSPDESSVLYGYGSKYVSGKVYLKHVELIRHKKKKSGQHVAEEVVDFCRSLGLLREEFTLKSRFLTQTGLCWLGEVTDDELRSIYRQRSQFRRFREMELTDTSDLSPGARGTLARYESGEPHGLKRSTFYRHRTEILRVVGVDISIPRSVEKVVFPTKVIVAEPLVAPDWYRKKYG